MRIDREAEELGRAAVVAAIAEDPGRFEAALNAMADKDRDVSGQAVIIYLAVARAALLAIHQGTVPNEDQNREHATDIATEESKWAPISTEDVYQLLEGLFAHDRMPDIPAESFLTTLFLTTGYFLSWYREGLGYKSFYDFLDAILGRLEAAPERG
jgi:hypothetical protein